MSANEGNPTEVLELDELHEIDWVLIPNEPYIMKYVFCDTGYSVLVSNLTSLYSEKMAETSIQTRFSKLNPFAQMKPRVILENLKKSLKKCLIDKSDFNMKLDRNRLVITLNFYAAHALCNFDIEMGLMPADKVLDYIIGPTVLGTFLYQQKILELEKKILSMENAKPSLSYKSFASQNAFEPDWLKGKNVPTEIVLDSFLKIQRYFKELCAENYEIYSSKKAKAESASSVQSVSPHKKSKLEGSVFESNINFEDDACSLIKKEEETSSTSSLLEPTRIAVKKKNFFKF